jgi:hypothetical protein
MPNTAVKPANAESTWGEAPWEDRKPLIQRKRRTENLQCVFFCALLYSGYLAIPSILCYSEIIIKRKEVKIMYPVQLMISYFTTSFTAIMHIGREVTAKQYTGGGIYKIIKIHIYKNRPRNGCALFHIDIKKDSVGIYCPFWHVCIRLLFSMIGYHLSAIQYGMTGA